MTPDLGTIRIVIAQRGFVFCGYVRREEHEIVVRHAKMLRRWGTTKGLGELADGPLRETVLDLAGTVRMHPLQVVATIDVEQAPWAKVLK